MYPMLVGAGLGKKKIEFSSSDKHDDVVKRITDVYPRLAKCDGFTLHKSRDGGTKRPLQKINTRWYDVIQLRKKYNSGKGVIYVKPLQENLNLNVATDEEVSLFYSFFSKYKVILRIYVLHAIRNVHHIQRLVFKQFTYLWINSTESLKGFNWISSYETVNWGGWGKTKLPYP